MTSRSFVIARYTVLEALRTRLAHVTVLAIALTIGLSLFVNEVALIEHARMQTAVYAAVVRFAAVFIVALHVVAGLTREFNDKGPDAVLALDIPRWQYLTGKYAGYAGLAMAVATLCALPLFAYAQWAPASAWLASLALELCIIAAVAVFCVVTFSHLPSAMAFVAGFYVLCRALTGLRLIGEHPIAGAETWAHQALSGALAFIALLAPPLDQWTRTAWLLDAPPAWSEFGIIGIQAAVYVVLLLSAALVDFYRKSL